MHVGGKRAVPRRRVLEALALAPVAMAACAAERAERGDPGGATTPRADPRGGAEEAAGAAAAIRAFPLAPDADPAFVFRAAAARPGDLR